MSTPLIVDPATFAKLREAAAESIMIEVDRLMMQIQTPDSGRLIETVVQLLSEKVFAALATLVIGSEHDVLVRGLVFTITIRIANKLGLQFNEQTISTGASSIMALINCENLRRKGHMEYAWPDNIFTRTPKYGGYMQLTEEGKQISYEMTLATYEGKTIQ